MNSISAPAQPVAALCKRQANPSQKKEPEAPSKWRGHLACRLFIVFATLTLPAQAQLDSNSNGMSDVWERMFNRADPGELFDPQNPDHHPDADPDGDGVSNLHESIIGTDPFDPNPPQDRVAPQITYLKEQEEEPSPEYPEGRMIDLIVISWDTLPGKQYTVYFSPNLSAGSWLPADAPYYGDGLPAAAAITLNDSDGFKPDKLFWRVAISDIDSDGDGLTDHEEFHLDTDPFNWDTSGNGLPDSWDILYAGQFTVWPPDLFSNLHHNETEPRQILLSNDTDTPVNFSIALADELGLHYQYEDSITGNATYTWEEISTTGTRLATISNSSNASQFVDLANFIFPFHGNTFSRIHISSNGLITLSAANSSSNNQPLPSTSSSAPPNLIAPFWDNLDTRTIGDVYVKQETDRLIIQYENVGRSGGGTTSAYTFQAVLYADGRIHFRYKSMVGVLNDATIGLQDSTRTIGLQVVHNAPYVANEMAVEISPLTEFFTLSPLEGTVAANSVLALDADFQSLRLPFGAHSAILTTTHDATSAPASPIVTQATLNVINNPAVVTLTGPVNDSSIFQGDSSSLSATASDPQGMVRVEFYSGETKIGERLASSIHTTSYSVPWNQPLPPVGIHILTAHAIDVFGGVTISDPVIFTVHADANSNRIPDDWELEHFGNLDQPMSGDFDGDGFPNIFEYHHNTSPADPEDFPQFSTIQTGPYKYYIVDPNFPSNTTFEKKTLTAAYSPTNDFDIIEVRPGSYFEALSLGRRLYLFATEGAEKTILEGKSNSASIITISRESVVNGFTIRNFDRRNFGTPYTGGGLQIDVNAAFHNPWIVGCVITNNAVNHQGGGVYVHRGSPTFVSCTIAGNFAPQGSGIFSTTQTGQINLINTLLWNPEGDGLDLAGQTSRYILDHSMTRDPASGAVSIDGVSLPTTNPGIASGWSLTHDSPARNAGTSTYLPVLDMHGETRPFGSTADIGADEFVDVDSDLLPDFWEIHHFGDLSQSWDDDSEAPEGDGLINLYEYLFDLDPTSTDTHGTGMGDLYYTIFSDTLAPWYPPEWKIDSDGDGLTDGQELYYGTDPNNPDTNGDGILDSVAIQLGYNPTDLDPDGDTLTNAQEAALGTNPYLWDTDGDGVPDHLDAFPLDPTRWLPPITDPEDTTSPVITLTTPETAIPQ